jgi:hypothetical protein
MNHPAQFDQLTTPNWQESGVLGVEKGAKKWQTSKNYFKTW